MRVMCYTSFMTCENCNQKFTARAGARTCSTKCRVALHRKQRPPKTLTSLDRWVRWSENKIPLRADGAGAASSTDPATWSSYAAVASSRVGVGAGFVLAGDGVACIDLDHCLINSVLADWAAAIVAQACGTFVEVSPSGTGLHVWGLAHVGQGRRMGNVEVYDRGRYMTVTGVVFGSSPKRLVNIQALVDSLILEGA